MAEDTGRSASRGDSGGVDSREMSTAHPRSAKKQTAKKQAARRGTAPSGPAQQAPGQAPRRPPRRRVVIRKVDPWSVLKLSLIFYLCVLLVVMLGLMVFWAVVNQLGIVDQVISFLDDLQLVVTIEGGAIARAIFLIGLLNVILWSGINVFLAFLYNLLADLVGGLRVTLADDE